MLLLFIAYRRWSCSSDCQCCLRSCGYKPPTMSAHQEVVPVGQHWRATFFGSDKSSLLLCWIVKSCLLWRTNIGCSPSYQRFHQPISHSSEAWNVAQSWISTAPGCQVERESFPDISLVSEQQCGYTQYYINSIHSIIQIVFLFYIL